MTDLIGLHEQYALVSPQTFVERLTDQWTTSYHNVPSVPLSWDHRIYVNSIP